MTSAILTPFHKYTPFGDEFYEPILDFYLESMKKYQDEYDRVYLLDSNWNIGEDKLKGLKAEIIKVDPSLRYYDAYKQALPQVKEDMVLFMDNDMVVYRKGAIDVTFGLLTPLPIMFEHYPPQVISILDTIGNFKTDKLEGKNKFCPYWFASFKSVLLKYRHVNWGPDMPEYETFGKLTEALLADDLESYEWKEDKSSLHFDGSIGYPNDHKPSGLGYYHIRAGSTPAYLLATRKYGDRQTYLDYIEKQPQQEYLRQMAWYWVMGGKKFLDQEFFREINVDYPKWLYYIEQFRKYHGLENI